MYNYMLLELNLHSTMYLLNLVSKDTSHCLNLFTFHYVSIKSASTHVVINTTCEFTFHYVSIKSFLSASSISRPTSFTFHYVSIKSKSESKVSLFSSRFTFHYVSIKSVIKQIILIVKQIHLHSTMYLLNPVWNAFISDRSRFTFHYVSIKSINFQPVSIPIYKFTFHYVSIKSMLEVLNGIIGLIYIPLCIY